MRGHETVTLLMRVVLEQDDLGNDVFSTVERAVRDCAVWPTGTSEKVQAQDIVTAGWTVLMPSGTAIAATDQVRVRGVVFDVDGEPFDWVSPITGHTGGVQVQLRKVTG